jgi:hypothetical protein
MLWVSLAIAAALPSPMKAENSFSPKDFDLACAMVAAAEIATSSPGGTVRESAMQVHLFYLGRLSGRDDKTIWKAVILGRVAELKEKAKSPSLFGTCLNFLNQKIS